MVQFLDHAHSDGLQHQLHRLYRIWPMPVGRDLGKDMAASLRTCVLCLHAGPNNLSELQE